MRLAVAQAWPGFCTRFEGRCSWMYLDVKYKVTTGTGNLIDSITVAQALPWLTKGNQPASPAQIAAEWRRVKTLTSLAKQGGYAYRASAQLHLSEAAMDRLLMGKTAEFWGRLKQTLPKLETFPADAQLALMDLAWQNGPGFLDVKSGGRYVWANTRAAALARDWTAAAKAVPGSGDRAAARKRLFLNAATVEAHGVDPDILWNTRTPIIPTEGFDMTAAKGIYKHTRIGQPIGPDRDSQVWITDEKFVTVAKAPNAGVDVGVTVHVKTVDKPARVNLWMRLVDVKAGTPDVVNHDREFESYSVPAGETEFGVSCYWKGSISAAGLASDRSRRLRVFIRTDVPITVVDCQVTGWEMPS